MNAQLPMDAEKLRDVLEETIVFAIHSTECRLQAMKRKSMARTELEISLARYKQALRAISGVLPVKAAAPAPAERQATSFGKPLRTIQNSVEAALKRRYEARTLQSEHDFLAGASAALMALAGDDHAHRTDAVPDDWRDLALGGDSVLMKISDGAD